MPGTVLGAGDSALDRSGRISALTVLSIPLHGSRAGNQEKNAYEMYQVVNGSDGGLWRRGGRLGRVRGGHAIFDG